MTEHRALKRFDPILQRQGKGTAFGPSVALDVLRELAARSDRIEGVKDIDLSVDLFGYVEAASPRKGIGYNTLVNTAYVSCLMFDDFSALLAIRQGSKGSEKFWLFPEPLQIARKIQDKETGHMVVLDDRRSYHATNVDFCVREDRLRGVQAGFDRLLSRGDHPLGHPVEDYVARLANDLHRLGDDLGRDYGFGGLHTMPPALSVAVPSGDSRALRDLQDLLLDARDYAARAGCEDPFSMVVHGFDGLADLEAATVSHVEITAPVGHAVWPGNRMGSAAAQLLNTDLGLQIIRKAMVSTIDAGVLRAVVARRALGMACGGLALDSIWPTNPDRAPDLMEAYGVEDPHPSAEPQSVAAMGA